MWVVARFLVEAGALHTRLINRCIMERLIDRLCRLSALTHHLMFMLVGVAPTNTSNAIMYVPTMQLYMHKTVLSCIHAGALTLEHTAMHNACDAYFCALTYGVVIRYDCLLTGQFFVLMMYLTLIYCMYTSVHRLLYCLMGCWTVVDYLCGCLVVWLFGCLLAWYVCRVHCYLVVAVGCRVDAFVDCVVGLCCMVQSIVLTWFG